MTIAVEDRASARPIIAASVAGSPKRSVIDQLQSVNRLGSDEETIDRLRDADALMWSVQAVRQLISEKPLNAADLVSGAAAFLLRETGVDDIATLEQKLADVAGKVAEVAEQVTADVKRDKPARRGRLVERGATADAPLPGRLQPAPLPPL